MIFPIRCFTCGKNIGHLWDKFLLLKKDSDAKTALNKLAMNRYCCRRMFITHVDLV